MSAVLWHHLSKRVLGTLAFEMLGVIGCLMAFALLTIGAHAALSIVDGVWILACALAFPVALWCCGLYSRPVIYFARRLAWGLGGGFVLVSGVLLPLSYWRLLEGAENPSAALLLFHGIVLPACFLFIATGRFVAARVFNGATTAGNTLILGRRDDTTRALIEEANRHHGVTLRLVGVLLDSVDESEPPLEGAPVLGSLRRLREVVHSHHVKTVIVNLPHDHPDLPMDFLLEWKLSGNQALDACVFYERMSRKVLIERLEAAAILSPGVFHVPRWRCLQKEVLERMFAAALLVGLSPLFALVALLVRVSSRGPVIYRQLRVGKGGKLFYIYKFRTMVKDAEGSSGPVWSSRNDPRVTPIGLVLRRSHLDEMPQLFNILKGEMSVVGPRPERPEFVRYLASRIECYQFRHLVKPGLTGWAQVSYPYASSLEESKEKLRYDLYYIKYMSLAFDLMIVLATVKTTLGSVVDPPAPVRRETLIPAAEGAGGSSES